MNKDVEVDKLSDEELDALLKDVDEGDLEESIPKMEYEDTGFGFTDFQPAKAEVKEPVENTEEPVENTEETVENTEETVKKVEETIDTEKEKLYAKIRELEEKVNGFNRVTQTDEPKQDGSKIEPEQFFENPDAAIEQKLDEIQARRLAEQEKAIRVFNAKTEETKKTLLSQVPDFEEYVDDIADYMKKRGMGDDKLLSEFKKNPYAAQNVPALVMLADIAKATKKPKAATVTPPKSAPSVLRPSKVKPESATSKVTVTAETIKNLSDEQLNQLIDKGRLCL